MKTLGSIVLMFCLFLFAGCFDFESIDQPFSAHSNSTFEVPITVRIGEVDDNITPFFGILLPEGWSVADSLPYRGPLSGILIYSKDHSDRMENEDPAPEGYFWWVSVGSFAASVDTGTCSLVPQIKTSDQTGRFSLKYVIGYNDNFDDLRTDNHPIWVWEEPPSISVTTDSLTENLRAGQTSTQTLTIVNTGFSDLYFNVSSGWKSALQFDGVEEYVEIPDNPALQIRNQITLEAWVKYEVGGTGQPRILSKGSPRYGYELLTTSTGCARNLQFRIGPGSVISNASLSAGEWYHLAAAYDGTQISLYVNGHLDTSKSASGSLNTSTLSLFIGKSTSAFDRFKGHIDEVRIWNISRTQTEIEADMHRELTGHETGLIGYWPFNKGSGNIAFDHSSNHNDGKLNGGDMWAISPAPVLNWLSCTPLSEILAAGAALDVTVTFDAAGLSAGSYDAAIEISSNDPLNRITTLPVHLSVDLNTGVDDLASQTPKHHTLYQNHPNPFNPTTVIEYDLPKPSHVRLAVYDVLGQHIRTLVDTRQPAGHFRVVWDGTNKHNVPVAPGVYFCRMEAGESVKVIKLTLVR